MYIKIEFFVLITDIKIAWINLCVYLSVSQFVNFFAAHLLVFSDVLHDG